MGQNITVTGMVLHAMPIGEYDKRIMLLTKDRGKITAFARGARRPNSQLLAATNPFSFGEFELFEGRSSYTVARASVSNYFRELTADPQTTYYGFYFLEFAAYYCQENNDEREMLKLLYQSLRALLHPSLDRRLVRAVFELKALTINGEGPNVFSCISCGRKDCVSAEAACRGGNVPGAGACRDESAESEGVSARPGAGACRDESVREGSAEPVEGVPGAGACRDESAEAAGISVRPGAKPAVRFSVKKGGALCGDCAHHATDVVCLNYSTIYTMQYVISAKIEKLYTFTVSGQVLKELSDLLKEYLKLYAGHPFKSLKILEEMDAFS